MDSRREEEIASALPRSAHEQNRGDARPIAIERLSGSANPRPEKKRSLSREPRGLPTAPWGQRRRRFPIPARSCSRQQRPATTRLVKRPHARDAISKREPPCELAARGKRESQCGRLSPHQDQRYARRSRRKGSEQSQLGVCPQAGLGSRARPDSERPPYLVERRQPLELCIGEPGTAHRQRAHEAHDDSQSTARAEGNDPACGPTEASDSTKG